MRSNEKCAAVSKALIIYSERDATLQACGNVGLLSLLSLPFDEK
jgi:hypothetical protein